MYIGPWQEYRLAKLQDDAIQGLRSKWEQQLRDQIPEGDDARIRELMQPMLAKLPSLLLASKSKRVTTANSGSSRGSCSASGSDRPETVPSRGASSLTPPPPTHSVASSVGTISGTTSRQSRNEDRSTKSASRQHNNQETHEDDSSSTLVQNPPGASTPRKTKKKGKKKTTHPLSALEEVQRRKQMFAKWIRTAATGADVSPAPGVVAPSETSPAVNDSSSIASASLPLIRRDTATADVEHVATQLAEPRESMDSSALRLPPLRQPPLTPARAAATSPATEWDFFKPYEPAARDPEGEAVVTQPDLDDSLDEDEVNHLLDWTDTLLSPGAMDAFPLVDEDTDALVVW